MLTEFESDPTRAREGQQIAKVKGKLRDKQPTLSRNSKSLPNQELHQISIANTICQMEIQEFKLPMSGYK
ncbi:hypothetical protein [Glutamicibacter sp. Je.9.36]|uniref:hypothetical protein n=1 Tax=Glutamicibacter sp. Je.9.36 TaxID=3142837 RepID=UPI003DA9901F